MFLDVGLGEGENLLLHLRGQGEEDRGVGNLLVCQDMLNGIIEHTGFD